MNLPPGLDEALKRLTSALDQLEAAASRSAQVQTRRSDLEEELAVMQDDRSRLAVELDAALAQNRALAAANSETRERLAKSATALRHLLGQAEAPGREPPAREEV